MFLGSSSEAIGTPADQVAIVAGGPEDEADTDAGIEAGRELLDFTDAVHALDESLEPARRRLADRLGDAAMIDAALIAAVFRGLNIAADTAGIRVDDNWEEVAQQQMLELGTDTFRTVRNNPWMSGTGS